MKRIHKTLLALYLCALFLPAHVHAAGKMSILVYPFKNTGDKKYSWVSAGMTDTVITDLQGIEDVTVISDQDRRSAIKEISLGQSGLIADETVVKVGTITGANVIFTGSYSVQGNRIRVIAKLIRVDTGAVEKAIKIDGTIDSIFDVQDRVVVELMGETEKIRIADIQPVRFSESDKKRIEEKQKPALSAYEWYAKGLEVQFTDPKKALQFFKNAIDIVPDYIKALLQAGATAGETLSLFSEGLKFLGRAGEIFQSRNENNTSQYANLLMNSGLVYWSKGKLDSALESFMQSKDLMEKLGLQNSSNYAALMMNMGIVYYSKHQLDLALEYYTSSMKIREQLGMQNTSGYAKILANIGLIYWSRGDKASALDFYTRSQDLLVRLGLQNTADYSYLLLNIGNVYAPKEEDRAIEYYMQSKELKEKLGLQDTMRYANLMTNLGNVYHQKGQLDRALEYYRKSKDIREKLGLQNTAGYGRLLYNFALLYEKKGNKGMAGRYYRESYNILDKANYGGPLKARALGNAKKLGY
jgi:tetratricopeptide (TPR) repeat protein